MTAPVIVRLLTGGDLQLADNRTGPSAARPRALFVLLALHAGDWVSRDRLCDYLWPYTDQSTARQRLRMALLNMKRGLPEELRARIRATAESIMLDINREEVDALRFMALADEEDAEAGNAAIALYDGDLLAQTAPISDVFDRFIVEKREEYRTALLGVLRGMMRGQIEARDRGAFVRTFRRAVQVDGADGDTAALGMSAAAAEGQPQRVREIFDAYAAAFRERFGADPPESMDAALASCLSEADGKVPLATGGPKSDTPAVALAEIRARPRVALRLPGGRARVASIGIAVLSALILVAGGVIWSRSAKLDASDGEIFLLRPDGSVTGDCGAEDDGEAIERALVGALQRFDGSSTILGAIRRRLIGAGPGIFDVGLAITCLEGGVRATITVVNTESRSVVWIGQYDVDSAAAGELSQRIYSEMEPIIRP